MADLYQIDKTFVALEEWQAANLVILGAKKVVNISNIFHGTDVAEFGKKYLASDITENYIRLVSHYVNRK